MILFFCPLSILRAIPDPPCHDFAAASAYLYAIAHNGVGQTLIQRTT